MNNIPDVLLCLTPFFQAQMSLFLPILLLFSFTIAPHHHHHHQIIIIIIIMVIMVFIIVVVVVFVIIFVVIIIIIVITWSCPGMS